jgi:hypothetical protein
MIANRYLFLLHNAQWFFLGFRTSFLATPHTLAMEAVSEKLRLSQCVRFWSATRGSLSLRRYSTPVILGIPTVAI